MKVNRGVAARSSSRDAFAAAGRRLSRLVRLGATALAVIWVLFPFYWGAITSIKGPRDNFGDRWLPFVTFRPRLDPWRALVAIPELTRAMANSVVLSFGAATIAVLLGAPAAYGIARFSFPRRWQGGLIAWFLAQRVLPPVVLMSPYLLLMRQLRLIDSVLALVLLNATLNLPLAVIILSGAFRDVPRELEEAAWVDGASRPGSFARIALPLVLPAIAASWILCLAFSWNEWMYASLIAYTHARAMPVLLVATGGGGGVNYQAASTRALATMIVPLAAAILSQRAIVRGLSMGAVKG